jgi:hypothetical protein
MAEIPVTGGLIDTALGAEGLTSVPGAPSPSDDYNKVVATEPLSEEQNPSAVGLSDYLRSVWETNSRHKITSGVQEQILKNLRARDGVYEAEKLAALQAEGLPTIYMGLTGVKCGHAER